MVGTRDMQVRSIVDGFGEYFRRSVERGKIDIGEMAEAMEP